MFVGGGWGFFGGIMFQDNIEMVGVSVSGKMSSSVTTTIQILMMTNQWLRCPLVNGKLIRHCTVVSCVILFA